MRIKLSLFVTMAFRTPKLGGQGVADVLGGTIGNRVFPCSTAAMAAAGSWGWGGPRGWSWGPELLWVEEISGAVKRSLRCRPQVHSQAGAVVCGAFTGFAGDSS